MVGNGGGSGAGICGGECSRTGNNASRQGQSAGVSRINEKGVLDATKGLSEAQWNFKPATDEWSVAECAEHIAAAEDLIRGMAVDKVMNAPAAPSRKLTQESWQ
jgi:hypothetical protein